MNFRRKGEQKYMKKRIVFELAAGILILVSALYTYVPKSQYMYELQCHLDKVFYDENSISYAVMH